MSTSHLSLALALAIAALTLACADPGPRPEKVVTVHEPARTVIVPETNGRPGPNKFGLEEMVYVTASGRTFHRATCREVKHSKGDLSMTRREAESKGYRACRICKPNEIM